MEDFERRAGEGHVLVVTDVRLPSEAEAIKRLGGRIYRIRRPGHEPAPMRWWQIWLWRRRAHSTERPIPEAIIDRTLVNSGRPEDLKAELRQAIIADGGRIYHTSGGFVR